MSVPSTSCVSIYPPDYLLLSMDIFLHILSNSCFSATWPLFNPDYIIEKEYF